MTGDLYDLLNERYKDLEKKVLEMDKELQEERRKREYLLEALMRLVVNHTQGETD